MPALKNQGSGTGSAPKIAPQAVKRMTDDLRRAQKALADIERSVEGMSDMGELDNLKLQQALQRQSQALQMLSNISKSMHDTTKSIISNLR